MSEAQPEATSTCPLCQGVIQPMQGKTANGHTVCPSCFAQIESEVAAQAVTMRAVPLALLGGGIGAVLAAAIWAGITIFTGYQVGYIAVLVGYLAGKGVVILNGKQRGRALQFAAVGASLVGLLLAKIVLVDYFVVRQLLEEGQVMSYFSPTAILTSILALPLTFSLFDILWVCLAVQVAWQLPRSAKLQVG